MQYNKDLIYHDLFIAPDLCEGCVHGKMTREESGMEFFCNVSQLDECHRVDEKIEDIEVWLEKANQVDVLSDLHYNDNWIYVDLNQFARGDDAQD